MLGLRTWRRHWSRYFLLLIGSGVALNMLTGCSMIDTMQKTRESMDTLQEANRQFSIEVTPDGAVPNDSAAKVWIDRAIALMPHSDVPFSGTSDDPGIIDILSARGRYPMLIEILKTAISDPKLSHDPTLLLSLADAQQRMGSIQDSTKNYAAAVVAINKSMTKGGTIFDPDTSIVLDRARAEYYGGQRSQSIKDFQSIIKSNPDQAAAAENDLAYFYALDKSDLPDAKILASSALAYARTQGDDNFIGCDLDTLAWVDHQTGNNDNALLLEQEAASLTPLEPDVQYHLGEICRAERMDFQARVAYTRAIKLDPFFPEAMSALQTLPVTKSADDGSTS